MGNRKYESSSFALPPSPSSPSTERGNESLAMMGGDLYHFPGDNNVGNWIGKQGGGGDTKLQTKYFKPKNVI